MSEKAGTMLLVLVGLTAVQQSDKILVDLKIFNSMDHIVRIFVAFNKGTVLL